MSTPSFKPTLIDERYSLDPLFMIVSSTTLNALDLKTKSLPPDYAWIEPEEIPSFRLEWAKLLVELGFVTEVDQALEIFNAMYQHDPKYFLHHLFAIKSLKDNHLACSVGLWPGTAFPLGKRIHWLMTSPNDQHQGLAKAALKRAMATFHQEEPNQTLSLSTQAASWPAILLYKSLGFVPYLEENAKASAKENQTRWSQAKEAIFKGEGVLI